ncbi:MAG: DUF3467 domain-containing protein [candidate division Zixibacteria bacterium]
MNPRQQQIKIELPDKEAEGIYANLAMISHSPTEIIIDFARVMPGLPKAKVLSRIIMTPMHSKLLNKALTDNLKKFEDQFGEVKMHVGNKANNSVIGFGSQDSEAGGEK